MQDDPVAAFNTRYSAIAAEGCVGAEIFERLAADASLPIYFDENQAAEIAGLTPSALKQRRYRHMRPTFLNHGARSVRYPRADLCRWLASLFVDRSAA